MQPAMGLQMWLAEGQVQVLAQSWPWRPSVHSNWHRLPMNPGWQRHLPSTLLQLAPLWQKHSWTQSGPKRPAGQPSVQWAPMSPPGQRHTPVTWWQSPPCLHEQVWLQAAP